MLMRCGTYHSESGTATGGEEEERGLSFSAAAAKREGVSHLAPAKRTLRPSRPPRPTRHRVQVLSPQSRYPQCSAPAWMDAIRLRPRFTYRQEVPGGPDRSPRRAASSLRAHRHERKDPWPVYLEIGNWGLLAQLAQPASLWHCGGGRKGDGRPWKTGWDGML